MNEHKDFNFIRERVVLSDTEKAEHRAALLSRMHATPMQPVPSPYTWTLFLNVRYAFVALLAVLVVSGSGVVVASEGAVPGSPFYGVKLTVNEPTRIALARTPKEKAALEVAYAERRLKEFAAATVSNRLDADTTKLIAASLEDRLEGAEENIDDLNTSGEGDDALEANSELKGVLAAHAKILRKVSAGDPVREVALAAISEHIDQGIVETGAVEPVFAASLESQESRGVLHASVSERQMEVVEVLEDLREDMVNASTTLDTGDHEELAESITEVTGMLETATREKDGGSATRALKLYTEADARIGELKALIEAEQELGIDLIGSEE